MKGGKSYHFLPSHDSSTLALGFPVINGTRSHHFYCTPPMWLPAQHPSMPVFDEWKTSTYPKLVHDINPEDVLSGRGGATNSHSGNRAFRSLVKNHQNKYLRAKKRDKPKVASIIVESVRKKGGRFLRRYERPAPDGRVLWIEIGDERAREKTCQALRENAPDLKRRKRQRSKDRERTRSPASTTSSYSLSGNEDQPDHKHEEDGDSHPNQKEGTMLCTPSIKTSCSSRSSESTSSHTNTALTRNGRSLDEKLSFASNSPVSVNPLAQCVPILIRPIKQLLPHHPWKPAPMKVDRLEPEERGLYLQDFVPPRPSYTKPHKRPSKRW